jgi:EmrB/QacA subfamily drug resistance transporter
MDEKTIHDRRWWTLSVLCLSLVMVIVGNTVLNVALPTLVRELDATATDLQWLVDAYALVFAGLLLSAGALGDRFGRKGALTIGLFIFGTASAVSALATSPGQLIFTRATMGVGAALVMPATLSILTNVFPPHERARAIGIWAGLSGAGAAIGPIAGGYLLGHFWWGSVFLLNVPIVLVALIGGRLLVPTSKDPSQAPLDPVGAVLSIAGLGALLYAIIEAPIHGWTDALTLASFGIAAFFLFAFARWEFRSDHPMLDLRLFKNRQFSAASGSITLVFFAMFGTFFLLTQYLQLVLNYTALEAGVRLLPMAITLMIVAPQSAKFVDRFTHRVVVAVGLMVVAVGLALFSTFGVSTGYPLIATALVVMAIGMSLAMPPSTTAIMASLPMRKAGVGSAVNDTTRELGGALGVAVLGSLAVSHYSSQIGEALVGLPAAASEIATSSLGGALAVAQEIGGPAGSSLALAARSSFVDASGLSLTIGAVVVAAASIMVWVFFPAGEVAHGHGPEGTVPAVDPSLDEQTAMALDR